MKKLTDEEIEAFKFKGHFIEEFLRTEYAIEKIITGYFLTDPMRYNNGVPLGFTAPYKDSNIATKNDKIKLFFEHTLFCLEAFTTGSKIKSMESVMQLSDPKLYRMLTRQESHLFRLLKEMMTFRNLLAHNVSPYYEKTILVGKRSAKFKSEQKTITKETGEKIIENYHELVPLYVISSLDDTLQNEILTQLRGLRVILIQYFENYISIEHEQKKNYVKIMSGLIGSEKIFNDAIGIDRYLRLENPTLQKQYEDKVSKRKKSDEKLLERLRKHSRQKKK